MVFALGREAAPFLRMLRPVEDVRGAPCRARLCGPKERKALVLETGIGAERTRSALQWLFECRSRKEGERCRFVVSAGFSGALQAGLRVGDIVLASEVIDLGGGRWPATWPGDIPRFELPSGIRFGRLLSTPHLIGAAEAKAALGSRFAAAAVDMETATVARLCGQHRVAFGCVRAISDAVDTSLSPQLVALISRSRIAPARIMAALAMQPALAAEMWRLARHTRLAAKTLAATLSGLLAL